MTQLPFENHKLASRIDRVLNQKSEHFSLTQLELSSLPSEIWSFTQLRGLPPEIWSFTQLRGLHIGLNEFSKLPKELSLLSQLTSLWAYGNKFASFPKSICNLTLLKRLYIRKNQIKTLPESIKKLEDLEVLDLRNNNLTVLPPSIGQLSKLKYLLLGHNHLSSLPPEIQKLNNLEKLDLSGNYQLELPPEVLNSPPQELLAYYFRTTKSSRKLNEAKVLFVGQGSVGKTSIVRRLIDRTFQKGQAKTEGINIRQWAVTNKEEESIRLNMWDFGGQEIMHATHQFFLTKRSLYVLVLDARAGEAQGQLYYWLEMIRVYGGNSPLLIVLNKCEEHYEVFDETRLRLDYDDTLNIAGFHYVSCQTCEGIDELGNSIVNLATSLPHVSNKLPADYFTVKEKLENQARNIDFITEEEYIEYCSDAGITNPVDTSQLLRFLHDLGSVLHYDDPNQIYNIRDTKVLNPEWVTDGVYRVLNAPDLLRAGDGIVRREKLRSLLSLDESSKKRYPAHRDSFLIDMMRKYEICFDFPHDPKILLVPELLSKNEPDVGWKKRDIGATDVLNFEYWYPILPRGLIPRFTVRMHNRLTKRPTYWRAGTVLEIEGCRVLVRGDLRAGRVFIQIQGKQAGARRAALAVVRYALESVHSSYGDLKAEAKVLLPADPDAPPVDYNFLLALEREGVVDQRFEKADRKYNVAELLNGVDERNYDLFLCHNSDDKPAVLILRDELQKRGIRCWLDESELTPGKLWQRELVGALQQCKYVAILIGPDGMGAWHSLEAQLSLDLLANSKGTVIPILLPGATKPSAGMPPEFEFLKLVTWMDFGDGFSNQLIERLVSALSS